MEAHRAHNPRNRLVRILASLLEQVGASSSECSPCVCVVVTADAGFLLQAAITGRQHEQWG